MAFITEADDMLAMLLSPAERRRPDKALAEMRKSGAAAVDGLLLSRCIALLCSASIVWFVLDVEFFMNTLGVIDQLLGYFDQVQGCNRIVAALLFYATFGVALSINLYLLARWVSLCATTSKCKAALLAWSDFFYNWAVFLNGVGGCQTFVGITTEDFWYARVQWVLGCGGGAVVSGCISSALQATADRLDKNERIVACERGGEARRGAWS